jgi:putative FmdB family regulatory protein
MPIYEYLCRDCRKKTTVFLRSFRDVSDPVCSHCGGKNMKRVISRFASPKSEEARMERLADPSSWSGLDENDPKSIAKWTRRVGKEMGDELGENIDAMVDGEMEHNGSGGRGESGGPESRDD